jgi:hypothetical protein
VVQDYDEYDLQYVRKRTEGKPSVADNLRKPQKATQGGQRG